MWPWNSATKKYTEIEQVTECANCGERWCDVVKYRKGDFPISYFHGFHDCGNGVRGITRVIFDFEGAQYRTIYSSQDTSNEKEEAQEAT